MTLYSPKVLVIPRKWWLRRDKTEKLLTGTLNLNTYKQNFTNPKFQASSLCGCTARSQTLKKVILVTRLTYVKDSMYTCRYVSMSFVMRKPAFCICKNKGADQLHGDHDHTADLRLCFSLHKTYEKEK